MRTNNELEGEFEDRIEGAQDEEPGNQMATRRRTVPSRKVSKKPTSKVPISPKGGRMAKQMPKGKFVTSSRPGSKVVKSKAKNRSGKKYKGAKHPPTVNQKLKSFGGMY